MSGLLGGILGIVNFVGGCALFVLIGGKAWKETDVGRRYRLWVGGPIVGLVLGIVSTWLFLSVGFFRLSDSQNLPVMAIYCFLGAPTLTTVFAFTLEGIRKNLE